MSKAVRKEVVATNADAARSQFAAAAGGRRVATEAAGAQRKLLVFEGAYDVDPFLAQYGFYTVRGVSPVSVTDVNREIRIVL